jgi:NAD(P)H-flavin reductase
MKFHAKRTDNLEEPMPPFVVKGTLRSAGRASEVSGRINPGASASLTLKIRDIRVATPRTRIIRLDLDGRRFDYEPGQALFLGAKDKNGSFFSLTVPPEESLRTGCLEILGRVGQPDNSLINSGLVQVSGPVGRFTLPKELGMERRLIFIAGGTGIAPVRSMLRRAMNLSNCRIELLYSARSADEFAYDSELRSLAQTGRIKLWQTVTRESGANGWTGARGRIGEAALHPIAVDPTTLFFVCGPLTLVNRTLQILREFGVPPERVRTDEW